MKFLRELVTWCGSASCQSASRREDEARSLVILSPPRQSPRPESRRHRGRKRGRAGASLRSKSAADWRPSLCSISEDNDATEREKRSLAGTERMLKRKVGSTTATATATATASGHVRSYSDDFGRNGFSAIITAFSPTPFLF